jgi:hypothetical protein
VPELIVAVEEGRIALYLGADLARCAPDHQRRFLDLADTLSGDRTITARCLAPSTPFGSESEA